MTPADASEIAELESLTNEPVEVKLSTGTAVQIKEIDVRQYLAVKKSSPEIMLVLMGEMNPLKTAIEPTEGLLSGLSICTRMDLDEVYALRMNDIIRLTAGVAKVNGRFFVESVLPEVAEAARQMGGRREAIRLSLERMVVGLMHSSDSSKPTTAETQSSATD